MGSTPPLSSAIVVQSKPSAVTDLCRTILSQLEKTGYGQDDLFAVHLACEEAFLNAVKHGNKMDPTKTVTVRYTVDPEKFEIDIEDQGEGFRPEDIPDPRLGGNLYKPEGRGLLLINAYMHLVEYNDKGNRVHMVRHRGKGPPAEQRQTG